MTRTKNLAQSNKVPWPRPFLGLRGTTWANEPTAALLAQYHLLDLIGENRLYPTNRHAIAAYRQEQEAPAQS